MNGWRLMKIILRPRTYIASPYRTETMRASYDNYLIMCMLDSLKKGEAPYAPHMYLTRVLNDNTIDGRRKGMEVGLKFLEVCQLLAVYKDFGISEGMQGEIDYAKSRKIRVELRSIQ